MKNINRTEAEEILSRLEAHALQPYIIECSSMGINVSFERCPKRAGGNMKKGQSWGKVTYISGISGLIISKDGAIKELLLSPEVRKAKYDLLRKNLCAICGKEGIDEIDMKKDSWGCLRYREHGMKICPDCIKKIYDKSPKPWKNN